MASTLQGGSGIGLMTNPVVAGTNNTSINEVTLQAGLMKILPPGQLLVTPGPVTMIQFKDPITNLWRSFGQGSNSAKYISSDGGNFRLANLTGCAIGAYVTNVGSAYTSAPTVTAGAGSSTWQAFISGAISQTVTVGAAGSGYLYPPLVIISPPPAGCIQATAFCTLSAGTVSTVTVVDQGAGYTTAPTITFVNDPRDTAGSGAIATTTLVTAGTIVAIVCTNHGTPVTSVPTLTISGGGGSSGAATAVMCFTATGFTVGTAGAVYGNAQPFAVLGMGGTVTGAAGAVINPTIGQTLITPRMANITGTSTSGGAVTATGLVVADGGLFPAVPTGFVLPAGTGALPTTTAIVTITVGGVTDTSLMQST